MSADGKDGGEKKDATAEEAHGGRPNPSEVRDSFLKKPTSRDRNKVRQWNVARFERSFLLKRNETKTLQRQFLIG